MKEAWHPPGLARAAHVWRCPEPRANLLLQHGYSEYAERYVHHHDGLIPALCEHGFNVHAFDLEGHGESPGQRGLVDVTRAVADHRAARQALVDNPLPLFLFGHSLGGLVTAGSTIRDPSGIEGVILTSPALPLHNVALRLLARVLAAIAPSAPAPLHLNDPSLLSHIPEIVEEAVNDPVIYHGKLRNRVAATALRQARHNRDHYAAWTVPTLILHGTADRITGPEGSRRMHEAIASRDKTLHLVEGGYHELLNDTGRDETLRVILDWLIQRLP